MKLSIALLDSGIKKNTSKAEVASVLPIVEKIFEGFLKKNPHFKGVKAVTITLTLCGKTKIRQLNKEYRQKDYATDVLSFPVYENVRPDKKVPKRKQEKLLPEVELGDLVICKDVAKTQAKEFDITYVQEVIHLACHGFLHLQGFDHEISLKEEKIMQAHEDDLVKKIYKTICKRPT